MSYMWVLADGPATREPGTAAVYPNMSRWFIVYECRGLPLLGESHLLDLAEQYPLIDVEVQTIERSGSENQQELKKTQHVSR